jgi:NodT family efflux transporter outer membrane factor (OMF) lipoprotein
VGGVALAAPARGGSRMSRGLPRRGFVAGVAAGIGVLLASCTVGPGYVRPEVAAPVQWKDLPPHKDAQPADTLPRGEWWRVFDDPVLADLESQVAAANQTLRAAEAAYRQSQAAVTVARAGLFPAIGGDLSATRARAGGTRGSGTANALSVTGQAQWELDLWGRVRRLVEAAQASEAATAADVAATRLSLQSELAIDYVQLRVADAARRVLADTVAAFERSLVLTQNRYAAGVVSRADVVQAQAQLLGARAALVDVDASRAQLEHAIAVLTGHAPADFSLAPVDSLPALPQVPVALPSTLLERRPDVAAAERRVAAANAQVGAATAAIFPTLSLSAAAGLAGGSLGDWLSLPNRVWSLGAAFAAPLFDAGLRRAQQAQAVAAYDATVADYRQTVLDAFREVEDNLAALRVLADEAAIQSEAVRAARESVALTTNQYKAGLVGFLDVVTVQAGAFNAERAALEIAGRRLVALVGLVKALGGGYEPQTSVAQADRASSPRPAALTAPGT